MASLEAENSEKTTVEIRDATGHTVRTLEITQKELDVLPMLNAARVKIAEGKATEAIACVVEAIRQARGEENILSVLDEAKRFASAAAPQPEPKESDEDVFLRAVAGEGTLLEETGREDILRHTLEEGSSVICRKCGGVVPSARRKQHREFWCSDD